MNSRALAPLPDIHPDHDDVNDDGDDERSHRAHTIAATHPPFAATHSEPLCSLVALILQNLMQQDGLRVA